MCKEDFWKEETYKLPGGDNENCECKYMLTRKVPNGSAVSMSQYLLERLIENNKLEMEEIQSFEICYSDRLSEMQVIVRLWKK